MKQFLYRFLLPALIAPVYAILRFTWRIREYGPQFVLQNFVRERKACIYAHWHGDELALVGYYSFRRLAVLSSLSNDGTLMANTLSLLGYRVFRGSSSRGGARGLIGLIRAAKAGAQTALAVDGPKGPIYEVKPGVVDLAERTGLPVIPVRTFADRAWFIPRAWNKSYLPKPFSRIAVIYGEPIYFSTDQTTIENKCGAIKAALLSLKTPQET